MAGSIGTSSLLSKIGEYEEELARNPASDIFVPLAEAYRKMGLLEEASAAIEKGLVHHGDLVAAHVAQGRIRAQQGDLEGAVFAFEQALQRDAQSIQGLKGLARVRLMQNAPRMAVPILKKLLQIRPDDPDVLKMKATCEAQSAAEKKDPDRAQSTPIKTATMVDIYLKQGLHSEALTLCREILADNPDNDLIRTKAAEIEKLVAAGTLTGQPPATPDIAAGTVPESEKKTLEKILEDWLLAINKRRSHVQ